MDSKINNILNYLEESKKNMKDGDYKSAIEDLNLLRLSLGERFLCNINFLHTYSTIIKIKTDDVVYNGDYISSFDNTRYRMKFMITQKTYEYLKNHLESNNYDFHLEKEKYNPEDYESIHNFIDEINRNTGEGTNIKGVYFMLKSEIIMLSISKCS